MHEPTPTADFIGQGFAFPLRIDHTGRFALARGGEGIDAAIRSIIGTAPGERLMRPEFGCRIWDLLFEPINDNTLGLMAQAVRDAMSQWEPRAELEAVEVTPDPDRDGTVLIGITYRVRATNDRRNLVYPFYVIPREEGQL
ncbi:MAG: GPW/gp25 family protein [Acidimicrobiales bacterium]